MTTNRRRYTRYQVAVSAEVEIANDTHVCETRDISMGGVAIAIEREVREGDNLQLTLILTQDGIEDPGEEPFQTQAAVMWSAPSDGGHWMAGLRFKKLADPQSRHLKRFLVAVAKNAQEP